jgi:hypothetical protein
MKEPEDPNITLTKILIRHNKKPFGISLNLYYRQCQHIMSRATSSDVPTSPPKSSSSIGTVLSAFSGFPRSSPDPGSPS